MRNLLRIRAASAAGLTALAGITWWPGGGGGGDTQTTTVAANQWKIERPSDSAAITGGGGDTDFRLSRKVSFQIC